MMNLRNRCLGYCTREAVNSTSFSEWWNSKYNMYEVDGLEINFVLKIIFCGNNEEVGRIIEMPYESLKKDMLEIVKI